MVTRRSLVKGSVAAPLIGAGILSLNSSPAVFAQDDTVLVGSKDFTEQFILGEIYLMVLEDLGISAEARLNLGGTQIAQEALVNGDISLYPEYTGTGLTEVLGATIDDATGGAASGSPVAASPEASPVSGDVSQSVYDYVAAQYSEQFGLVWLERSPANNTQALAVKRAFSEETGIVTVSDLLAVASEYTISAPVDFADRQDGLKGLIDTYGEGFADIEVLPVAPGLKYQALLDDDAQVVLAFGTDGQISGYDLVILEDDMGLWPPYNVAPVVRQEVLDSFPEIADAFNAVTASLTDEVLSGLNWLVDGDEKQEPAEVAEEYLTSGGFIGG